MRVLVNVIFLLIDRAAVPDSRPGLALIIPLVVLTISRLLKTLGWPGKGTCCRDIVLLKVTVALSEGNRYITRTLLVAASLTLVIGTSFSLRVVLKKVG